MYIYNYTRMRATQARVCPRIVHRTTIGRSSERGRCTERMHDEAPQSTATLRDRRFVVVLHLVGEKEGSPPVSECLSSTLRTSISSEIYVPLSEISRCAHLVTVRTCESWKVDRGGGCVLTFVAVHSDCSFRCFFFPCECELSCVTTEFEESPRNAEFQRQKLSIVISRFQS